jgi:hypothetical protein
MNARRQFLATLALVSAAPRLWAQSRPLVEIWKSPTCGCCGEWTKHLQKNGFATKVNYVEDTTAIRREARIPEALGSCHTARVGGYSIEGHVPAKEIRRLLAERPKAVGLTVPGMPQSAPGMDQAGNKPYDVLLIAFDGRTSLYQRY